MAFFKATKWTLARARPVLTHALLKILRAPVRARPVQPPADRRLAAMVKAGPPLAPRRASSATRSGPALFLLDSALPRATRCCIALPALRGGLRRADARPARGAALAALGGRPPAARRACPAASTIAAVHRLRAAAHGALSDLVALLRWSSGWCTWPRSSWAFGYYGPRGAPGGAADGARGTSSSTARAPARSMSIARAT